MDMLSLTDLLKDYGVSGAFIIGVFYMLTKTLKHLFHIVESNTKALSAMTKVIEKCHKDD